MAGIRKIFACALRFFRVFRRRSNALRELETLDQATLNDLGMSRAELVSLTHGRDAGECAAY